MLVQGTKKGEAEKFGELIEQIELAEELGYDTVWLTEHHFSEYGRASVPVLASYAAARTQRIRVSTAIVVLPFHHPLRVAEDWATLDHLLEGRLDVGVGRGNQPGEFAGLGVSMNEARERFQESLDIIRRAWTQETFSYDGTFWNFPELEVLPKPVQRPHPPLWQPAVSAYTVKMIIDNGINGLIGPYLTPFDVLRRNFFDPWHDAKREAGRADLQMAHNEFVYVGETEEQVKRDIEESIIWYVRTAAKLWGERDKSKAAAQYGNYSDVLDYFKNVSFEEIYEKLGIFGTPDQVAEKIRWMRDEGGVDHLMNFMWFGGIDHEKAMRNMKLFAKEVMPQFQGARVGEALQV